ncbi:hypothetical protein [Halobellus rarus]|uniref:DUF2795 domain-containing protein n=1 Tax=Halobellus rarus TaxID=1126237 RepID=A0ABD6CM47_9EURY|nr:hypothetical protein [Halobellus rarus]
MKINELFDFLDDELEYPIDHDAMIERIGDVEIGTPADQKSDTVSTIVSGVGQETYGSADELYKTIIGNVSDEYIGRKYYDDRGGNPAESESAPKDDANVSF